MGRRRDEVGASAVEYGLMIAAIAAVVVLVLFALGGPTIAMFKGACDDWTTQETGATCP